MSVNTKAASAPPINQFTETQQVNQATQLAQYTLLMRFRVTVVFILSSLWSLV